MGRLVWKLAVSFSIKIRHLRSSVPKQYSKFLAIIFCETVLSFFFSKPFLLGIFGKFLKGRLSPF